MKDKDGFTFPKYSEKYRKRVKEFVKNTFAEFGLRNEMKCPCRKCDGSYWSSENDIFEHLICNGLCPQSIEWIYKVLTQKKNDIEDEMDFEKGLGLENEFEEMIEHIYVNNSDTEHGGRKGTDDEARKFYQLVEEDVQPLYPDCTTFTLLSFIVRLYN